MEITNVRIYHACPFCKACVLASFASATLLMSLRRMSAATLATEINETEEKGEARGSLVADTRLCQGATNEVQDEATPSLTKR